MNNHLLNYTLQLADTSLILGHRLSEWCAHAPILEQDMALTNIALDLIGEARNYYQYAAKIDNTDKTEDDFAYFRDTYEFLNPLLVELPNGDFAQTIVRQFLFDAYHCYFLEQLQLTHDHTLKAIAQKSIKEVRYHLQWSSEWLLRLGDGTQESHQRTQKALDELWQYTGELSEMTDTEKQLQTQDISVDLTAIEPLWRAKVVEIINLATLKVPLTPNNFQKGGKNGRHSEYLGYLLAEMQFLQRAYPNNQW